MNDQRLLFITLSNIGDLVLTTPALVAMHEAYPHHAIDIVADARSSSLLRACPYLGEIYHRDKNAGWRGLANLIATLRRTHYDLIVDLRTDILPWVLRGNIRVSRWRRGESGPHATQQHFAVVARVLNHFGPIPPSSVWIGDADRKFASNAFARFKGARCLALAPGANWPGKIWPVEHFQALVQLCVKDFDTVAILGNSNDAEIAVTLVTGSPLPVLNFVGQTSLTQAAAVLDHVTLFVGNDSGLGHIAAARKIKTLTLFGPGDPTRYRPWSEDVAIVEAPMRDLAQLQAQTVAVALSRLLGDGHRSSCPITDTAVS